ncbi:hypothetical protein E1B28_012290 [Marasmius oreades]|uniref:Ser-Thr-rich glycosyl-phosphatidyl-inositol-anchored membrane family-domain-containing protein n=1 Tax=Marasmius oreades TaxID=181124 RepID=A0A9P7UN30_9AGAR|nr:uncharacterized protein E1B28_012290 [Marasmius oreades]KAG7088277.1 hypothetical protein E1B28_012290 [Marasmius oreades]
MIMFSLTLTILCLVSSLTYASPLFPRIVFNPNITVPDANTAWAVGTTQTVKWDATGLPDESLKGMVVLGHIEGDDDNEHLMLDPPLAKGFLLRDGAVTITIPDVPSRSDYVVVVFGDSGNASPKFTINNPNQSSSSTLTASSTSSLLQSATITDPIPISGTTITGSPPADPSTTITPVTTSSISQITTTSTSTAPPTSASSEGSSGGSSVSVTTSSAGPSGTSADSQSGSNAAWKVSSGQPFVMIAFTIAVSLAL